MGPSGRRKAHSDSCQASAVNSVESPPETGRPCPKPPHGAKPPQLCGPVYDALAAHYDTSLLPSGSISRLSHELSMRLERKLQLGAGVTGLDKDVDILCKARDSSEAQCLLFVRAGHGAWVGIERNYQK